MLYLDYAASTPLRPSALKVLEESLAKDFANPSSAHQLGRDLFHRIESCRENFLKLLGADKRDRLIFTGSATESNNTLIEGVNLKAGDCVVVSRADHPSVTAPMERLRQRNIVIRELLLKPGGTPDEDAFLSQLDETVKLVILSHVNNQSGGCIDIYDWSEKIKKICPMAHIHIDAAQSFGKFRLNFREGLLDSMAISAHKMGGPKGVAALLLRRDVSLCPLLYGGEQEYGLRSSTLAAPLIFSFYQAALEAIHSIESSFEHVSKINQKIRTCLREKVNTIVFPFVQHISPYILTFILPGISSDIILRHLEQRGIMVSTTSACSSKIKGTNPVFKALHIPAKNHKNVMRVSFSHETSEADAIRFCHTLAEIIDNLKPFFNNIK